MIVDLNIISSDELIQTDPGFSCRLCKRLPMINRKRSIINGVLSTANSI